MTPALYAHHDNSVGIFENEQRRTLAGYVCAVGAQNQDAQLIASRRCSLTFVASSLGVPSSCPVLVVVLHQLQCFPTSLMLQYHSEIQQSVSHKTTQLEQTCGLREHTELLLTLILNLPGHTKNQHLETFQVSICNAVFHPRGNIVCIRILH